MTSTTDQNSPVSAFVLVPFRDACEARSWAAEQSDKRSLADPPMIVTEGAEHAWIDPNTGEPGYEVTFAGGWRAKVAGGGSVTIGIGDRRVARSYASS